MQDALRKYKKSEWKLMELKVERIMSEDGEKERERERGGGRKREREKIISSLCSTLFNTTLCIFRVIDFSSEFILVFNESIFKHIDVYNRQQSSK